MCACILTSVTRHEKGIFSKPQSLSPVVCTTVPYFSTLSYKRYDFLKRLLDLEFVFLFSLQLSSEIVFLLRRIQHDVINVHRCSFKVPVILVKFQLYQFTRQISENFKYKIS